MNCLKNTLPISKSQSDIYKKLRETEGGKNENRVYLIKKVLN